jgi:hypothetical protein
MVVNSLLIRGAGSCWAFSAVSTVESINQLVTGEMVTLSEQELVECSTNGGNSGCNGGLMDDAFDFIINNGGIDTEDDYPYKAVDGKCDINRVCLLNPFCATLDNMMLVTRYSDLYVDRCRKMPRL